MAACVLAAPAQAASRTIRNIASASHSVLATRVRSNETLLEVALPQYSVTLRTSTPTAVPGQTVTFTARVDNQGFAAAPPVAAYTVDGVASTAPFVLLPVPADADYAGASGVSLYHYAGRPAGELRSGTPAPGAKVDAIGLRLAQGPGSGQAEYSLQVVPRNVPAVYAKGVTLEVGAGVGADGGAAAWLQAGAPARTQVKAPPATLRVYADQAAAFPARAVYVGNSAWLRLEAQACNLDPNVVDVRSARVTTSDGDTERIVATETAADSGVFQLQQLPTRHGAPKPASEHLESPTGATVTVAVDGCFAPINASFQLIDPRGTVFDSATNAPLDGMTVSLLTAPGGSCSGTLASVLAEDDNGKLVPSPNPFRSANGGRFEFPLVPAGSYCLQVQSTPEYTFPSVQPLSGLPAGRILATGSLGAPFPVGPGPEPVVLDLPIDPTVAQPPTLFVAKKPSRTVVLVGEQLDFTVTVRNVGEAPVKAIQLRDAMSAGLSFVPGTVRVNGVPAAEAASGARLTRVALPDLEPGQTHTVTYRAAVTPSAGDDVRNAAFAAGRGGRSNTAEVKVQVRRGFETDNKGVLTGTVYLACGRDGAAAGMPGVRLLLEDGTSVITDKRGRFSRYGLRPGTHALKLDAASLPDGVRLAAGARALDFVDLKDGELFKRDIALECSPAAQAAAQARARTAPDEEVFRTLDRNFTATVAAPVLAGVVGPMTSSGIVAPAAAAAAQLRGVAPASPPASATAPAAAAPATAPPAPSAAAPAGGAKASALEAALLAAADNKAAILNLAEGQVLPTAITSIQVKAPAESRLELSVNGELVPATRIGQRSLYPEKAMMGVEFVAVQLKPGPNEIKLLQKDQFGNRRGTAQVSVIAPGELAQIGFSPVGEGFYAGDAGQVLVRIRLLDAAGVPVTARLPVTLTTEVGQWLVPGTLEADGAVRVFVEGGEAQVALTQPAQATRVNVTAASGSVVQRQTLDFVPRARPFIAAGVAEGVVRLRSGQAMQVAPTTSLDAFSRELQGVAHDFGRGQVGARAALYLKGKVRGDYLLTLAYDSDKQTRERLFRDISPDEFYPVYGDDSTRAFDAQSTSKLYVRVEKGHSWVLVGDFGTEFAAASGVKPTLSAYNRPVTGAATHLENGRVAVDAFVTRDRTRQQVLEFPANGTSGPYAIGATELVPNSERVEIVVRDRLNVQVELRRTQLTRLQDYEIEELSGRIQFRSPLFAFDAEGNPVFVRVTFEVDTNQAAFTTAGAQATAQVADNTTAAARMVRENNPAAPYTLQGAIVQSQLGTNLQVTTEVARSERGGAAPTSGIAGRVEVKGAAGPVDLNAVVTSSGQGFDNTSSGVSPGRLDATAAASLKLTDSLKIVGKLAAARDKRSESHQEVAYVGVETTPLPGLTAEAGLRSLKDIGAAVAGQAAPQTDITTLRAKVSLQPQALPELTAFVEGEQALEDHSQHLLAGGVSYQLSSGSKLYARHELVNTLPVLSSSAASHQKTALGFESAYGTGGRFYGELRDTAGQGLSQPAAAFGLKDSWEPLRGVRVAAGLERVQALRNAPAGAALPTAGDSLAMTTSMQLNFAERWRAHARVEVSRGDVEDTLLVGSGLAYKLSEEWTLLARQAFFRSELSTAPRLQITSRVQLGSAWRSVGRDALLLAESVREPVSEGGTRESGVISVQYGQEVGDKLRLSTRLAARTSRENTMGMATRSHAAVGGLRASWQVDRKWNLAAQTLYLAGAGTRSLGLGLEAGYRFTDNLWLVVGYNFMEARDPVLARDEFSRGLYFRVRYLFDETALDGVVN